jgi:hypothetical protein
MMISFRDIFDFIRVSLSAVFIRSVFGHLPQYGTDKSQSSIENMPFVCLGTWFTAHWKSQTIAHVNALPGISNGLDDNKKSTKHWRYIMDCKETSSVIRTTGRFVILVTALLVLTGCQTVRQEMVLDNQYAIDKPPKGILDIVRELPEDASQDDLEVELEKVLSELGRATRQDMPLIRQATILLRNQPNAAKAFANMYENTPKEAFQKRLVILQVAGELQRADALPFLREVAWSPLPPVTPGPSDRITEREYEEMLKSKAVQNIAYLREDNGDLKQEAIEETVRIMRSHPAQAVRITAIDAYMWNHSDTTNHAAELYEVLPQELHKYVERPRFYHGMNQQVFNARLKAWRKKWSR